MDMFIKGGKQVMEHILSFLLVHLNCKEEMLKLESTNLITKEENIIVVEWNLTMQRCELSITLWYLKMKVAKFPQTRQIHCSTFYGIDCGFKHRPLELNNWQEEGLKIIRTQDLINKS
jgi:hypothetical protein